jgi:hypothetical protein
MLHPSSGIWLAGSVRFSTWLDWFPKIGHLAKLGGGTDRTQSTKKRKEKDVLYYGSRIVSMKIRNAGAHCTSAALWYVLVSLSSFFPFFFTAQPTRLSSRP